MYSYRRMTEADLDHVHAIENSVHQHPWSIKIIKDCLSAGYVCTVCLSDEVIVGFSILTLAVGESHLLNICIKGDFQGKGIGRALLKYSVENIKELGAESVYLEVRPSNLSAISLYESVGFESVGRRKDYYPTEQGREDALLMNLSLVPR